MQQTVDWNHTSLISNAYLESFGLTATSWNSVCCLSCAVAFAPNMMLSHLKKNDAHKYDWETIDPVLYQAALDVCDVHDELPPPPTSFFPPIAGLALHEGFACDFCFKAASTEASLLTHYKTAHKDDKRRRTCDPCFMQRFNNTKGPESSWFQVYCEKMPEEQTILDAFLQEVEQKISKTPYDPTASNDPRTVAPWLLSTGWHEEVQNMDVKALCASVDGAKEYKPLHAACAQWVHSTSELEDQVVKHVRKKINTEKLGDL